MEKQTISAELEVTGESTFNKNINVKGKIQENGNDLLPSGAIIMWYGNKIPNGWKICNGNESTPDLRGRFILGVSDNKKNKISMGSTGGKEKINFKKTISGSGLDMGKEEYIYDIDKENRPPYFALYYIMKT